MGKPPSEASGRNMTLMFCTSATGQIIPNRLIFLRTKINQRLSLNVPADTLNVVQRNGWMNSDIFLAFLIGFFEACSGIARKYSSSDSRWLQQSQGSSVIRYSRHKVPVLCDRSHIHKLQPLERMLKGA